MKANDTKAERLNETARLYPWALFNQGEIELMTRLPREAVALAFAAPDVRSQFGRTRPEEVVRWIRTLEPKIQTKAAKGKRP